MNSFLYYLLEEFNEYTGFSVSDFFKNSDNSIASQIGKIVSVYLIKIIDVDSSLTKDAEKILTDEKSTFKESKIFNFFDRIFAASQLEFNLFLKENNLSDNLKDFLLYIKKSSTDEMLLEKLRTILFPEALLGKKPTDEIEKLQKKRTLVIKEKNKSPLTDIPKELLFTSNVLLTLPLNRKKLNDKFDDNFYQKILPVYKERQLFWYDHPIPLDIDKKNSEIVYGIKHLNDAIAFEYKEDKTLQVEKMDLILSVSVTHRGLQKIAGQYLSSEIKDLKLDFLNVYAFTEDVTEKIVKKILVPIYEKSKKNNSKSDSKNIEKNLLEIFGVNGKYGRHYSFLKAISLLWKLGKNNRLKGTFKIDLDQIFPQERLKRDTNLSLFQHFKSDLWGARAVDCHGEDVELGMIAGSLVNESDFDKSLYSPDVKLPDDINSLSADEFIFFSRIPQAISTKAEMIRKKENEKKNQCGQRFHVTGGTNGILLDSLKKYSPFTPTFIERAEDQSYIMSVLFKKVDGARLRYLHKDGLIMRHDKESFAEEAIDAAMVGKIIGDYVRILLFSKYANVLPWDFKEIKDELAPFTSCFISQIPITLVFLRFIFRLLFMAKNKDSKTEEFLNIGMERILETIDFIDDKNNNFSLQYERERKTWDSFYEIINYAEKNIDCNFISNKIKGLQEIFNNCKV